MYVMPIGIPPKGKSVSTMLYMMIPPSFPGVQLFHRFFWLLYMCVYRYMLIYIYVHYMCIDMIYLKYTVPPVWICLDGHGPFSWMIYTLKRLNFP